MAKPSFLSEAVLYHDYRSRSFKDFSGNNNDGSPTDVYFTGNGIGYNQASSLVEVANSSELELEEFTYVVLGDFTNVDSAQRRIIEKADGSNIDISIRIQADNLFVSDDTTTRTISISGVEFSKLIAVNVKSGENAEVYTDGTFADSAGNPTNITTSTATVNIGSSYVSDRAIKGVQAALIFPRKLTATEHSELYCYLSKVKFNTNTDIVIHEQANVIEDGDMEAKGTDDWIAGSGAILSKEQDPAYCNGGTQSLRVTCPLGDTSASATQTILNVGLTYKVTGYFKNSGGAARVLFGTTGNAVSLGASDEWKYFEATGVADSTSLQLNTNIPGGGTEEYSQWDNIVVQELGKTLQPVSWQTSEGVYESVANQTEQLENSPFKIESGSFKVTRDTINGVENKVIECISAGVISVPTAEFRQTPTESAYGEWNWLILKAADLNSMYMQFIASVVGGQAATGQNAYQFMLGNDEKFRLRELINGSVTTNHFIGDTIYDLNTWYDLKITRTTDGEFSMYVDNQMITADTGSNPFTDTTWTESKYMTFEVDAGDKIAYAPNSIKKHLTT